MNTSTSSFLPAQMARPDKIMVAMSGGVDSSVTAAEILASGIDCAGMFMKNWEEDDDAEHCPAARDADDARAVAEQLGLPFYARNFASEYWDHVFEDFLQDYRSGRTPNPDILCNKEIKFKVFLDHAHDLGASHMATGHYVRKRVRDGRHELLRGVDTNKDQSYFLYAITQQQLAAAVFPVGAMHKPDVRLRALQAGLPVHDKKDSTGICFIGERRLSDFLARWLPARAGDIRIPGGKCWDSTMAHSSSRWGNARAWVSAVCAVPTTHPGMSSAKTWPATSSMCHNNMITSACSHTACNLNSSTGLPVMRLNSSN